MTRGVGRSAPLHPLGRRGARGVRPSRALPGLFWRRLWFPTMRVVLLWTLFPTARTWGAPLPYTPSGDGVREGYDTLALSRGLFWRGFGFPTMRAVLLWTLFPTAQA